MKLRVKFFFIFSFLAVIPLCVITWFAYSRYVNLSYERMEEISDDIFQNAVTETNNTLEDIKQSVSYLTFDSNNSENSIIETLKTFSGDSDEFTSYDILKANQYCTSVFQNIMLADDDIYGILIFTPSGVTFSCSTSQYSSLDSDYEPEKEQWYKDTVNLNGSFYISAVSNYEMFIDGDSSVFFARSVSDVYSHEFLGVLLVNCDPDIFDLSTVNTLSDAALLSISNKDTGATLYSNIDELSQDFYSSDRQVKKADLSVGSLELTAVFNYDAMFREFNMTGMLLLSIAVTCTILFLILTYFLTKNMIHPIEHLSRAMSRQTGHDFSFSSHYMNRTDEIGTLYNEYGRMLEELDSSIKRDYQDKLIALDAQMKSLEARINSHFLFNTLESINSMAELDDNEPIATMSLALGNMFRYSIKTQSELVSIADELKHVQDYISIQSIRFDNKFHVDMQIPQDMYSHKVLKLILQPLVENALYHGLNYCTCGDEIQILGRIENNLIYLDVKDNGKGMSPETLHSIRQRLLEEANFTELGHRNKQSIGLTNIHTRIELYYGRGYGLTISSTEGEGTIIEIKIPVLEKEGM